ncbi:MAG: hypothetical protein CMM01_15880 [Rhodopirellula sp.]|nr:hypothetical protein [Rhodopirellula sp.]
MHSVLLVDLAAVVSEHGPAILYGRDTLSPEALTKYWTATHARFSLWHQAMARYRRAEQTEARDDMDVWWSDHTSLMEEILVSEMLTRVLAALGAQMDAGSEDEEVSPVTHAILLNHLEASNRVHQIMLKARGTTATKAERLNRIRQGIESWSDVLIGRMSTRNPAPLQYALDRKRATEYADEAALQGHGVLRKTSNALMNISMHNMIFQRMSSEPALPAANREVSRSVMLMLRPELFDSVGVLKSLWMHRLENSVAQTDRMLDELTSADIHEAETSDSLELTGGSYFERWCK